MKGVGVHDAAWVEAFLTKPTLCSMLLPRTDDRSAALPSASDRLDRACPVFQGEEEKVPDGLPLPGHGLEGLLREDAAEDSRHRGHRRRRRRLEEGAEVLQRELADRLLARELRHGEVEGRLLIPRHRRPPVPPLKQRRGREGKEHLVAAPAEAAPPGREGAPEAAELELRALGAGRGLAAAAAGGEGVRVQVAEEETPGAARGAHEERHVELRGPGVPPLLDLERGCKEDDDVKAPNLLFVCDILGLAFHSLHSHERIHVTQCVRARLRDTFAFRGVRHYQEIACLYLPDRRTVQKRQVANTSKYKIFCCLCS
mmetsp:Transcript_25759/g.61351  ORF Transcript_25759/g.61351 Transcript_25759/m.61351 type:complete len:314 (+) Transcript_25759:130-1071(+)